MILRRNLGLDAQSTEDAYRKGVETGRDQGRKQGYEEGRKAGYDQGLRDGSWRITITCPTCHKPLEADLKAPANAAMRQEVLDALVRWGHGSCVQGQGQA